MHEKIDKFKYHVKSLCDNPNFIHNAWYFEYHLQIVEKISSNLCLQYPTANKNLTLLLVWLHDYKKIAQYNTTEIVDQKYVERVLQQFGFDDSIISKSLEYVIQIDLKENLSNIDVPLEVKIISSADGASHLLSPFYFIYWKENYEDTIEEIISENLRKLKIDWEKKIVLPELQDQIKPIYHSLLLMLKTN